MAVRIRQLPAHLERLADQARDYAKASSSANTQRAYASDWRHFESWRRRAGPNDSLAFVCELGPKPYAITGRDGNDTTDRWAEALLMREHVRKLWAPYS